MMSNKKKEEQATNSRFIKKYLINTSSMVTIFLFTLLAGIACNGQGKLPIKPPEKPVPHDKLKTTTEKTDSIVEPNHSTSAEKINQYKNGQKEGWWKTFYKNGQLKSEGRYTLGLKEGLHKEWQDNGILLLEGFYEKGKSNGLMKWFHERGHLAGEGNMKDGIRYGKWTICDVEENGFCIEAFFKEGKREGVWKIMHEQARDKIWKEETYKDDKLISEKCWDEKGNAIECE